MKTLLRIPVVLMLTLAMWSCKKSADHKQDSGFGPYAEYIQAVTSGVVSKKDPIVIKLVREVEGVTIGGELPSGSIRLNPSVKGKARWKSNSQIVFEPEQDLQSNTGYQVTFELKRFVKEAQKLDDFNFSFSTIPLSFSVETGHLMNPDINDFAKIELSGKVLSSDFILQSDAVKLLNAKYKGKSLPIEWTHDADGKTHHYTVKGIVREKKDQELLLSWDGKVIGIDEKGEKNIEIPSVDRFKIMSAEIHRDGNPYISLIFSDPIQSGQDFSNYIQVKNHQLQFVTDRNELKVYGSPNFRDEIDLKVFKNLKNSAGLGLNEGADFKLRIYSFKPQVVIKSGKGTILPSSNNLVLPIEVVGLKAIEVSVVRVFASNVSQYLQDNEIGSSPYYLRKVGRPVVKKIIPLVKAGLTDYYSWSKISLDLKDIFEAEPGAFYKVEISFDKDMAVYNCKGMDDKADIAEYSHDSRTLDWDDQYSPYYGEYDWNQRDNPCHDMYYRDDKKVSKMLFASDIGLTAKRTENNKLHVLTTNIVNAESMPTVSLQLFDYQNQLISEAKSDQKGMAEMEVYRKPFLLVAKKDNQFAYLKLMDGNALSLSNFDVSGAATEGGMKGFIYGERGVWRPGDTLHLSFILEDTYKKLPDGQPVLMELYNPQGQLYRTYSPIRREGSIFSFKASTLDDAPTGNWYCKIRAGSASFTKNLKIETIKPNRLKIDLKFDKEILKKSEGNYADLSVRWMHGAIARNLKAEIEMSLYSTKTKFKDFHGFSFDDLGKDFYSESTMIFDNRVDNQGNARFPIKIGSNVTPPGMLRAAFSGKVFEEGGDFSIMSKSVLYSPYSSYVGISVPSVEETSSQPVLYTGKNNTIRLANVDENGQKMRGTNVTVELYKLQWRWWWDYGDENISNYVGRSYSRPTKTFTVSVAEGVTDWNLNISDNDWGRYYIRVKDQNSGHSSGEVVYFRRSDWYGTMAKEMGGASLLNFELSTEKTKVGETVSIKIPSSGEGYAYISLETGKAVIRKDYIRLSGIETDYSFKISEDMAPNIYVHISLIQPHGQLYNDLPLRLYGVRNIMVENEATKLHPVLKSPEKAQPGEKISIEVSERNKQGMAYTIALVDEGLLALTNYKNPQPWDHFFAREALGVRTFDMFDDVLGAFTARFGRLLAVGGDEMGPMEEKSESRFKPVVRYIGPFYLKKGSTAKHELVIPQYIGELRVMLVAADAGKYGAAGQSISINQPLMLLATLPRVMGPGEKTQMPMTLFARDESMKEAEIEIRSSGKLKLKGEAKRKIKLTGGGESIAFAEIEAEQALGSGKVEIIARSGKNEARHEVNMQVRASNPPMTSVTDRLLENNQSWEHEYKALGMIGTNEGVVELSILPPLNLEQRTQFLIRYPHGCVEQTTSAVFAQLYLGDLIKLEDAKRYEIQSNIEAAIGRLRNFQVSNGGFAYWPGLQEANEWGTNYAGHFLLAAQKRGYTVPADLIKNFKDYQTSRANSYRGGSASRADVIQAYRLYTLALAEAPAMAAMNRMREDKTISELSKWLLANAYAEAGHGQIGEEMIQNLSTEVSDYRELSGTFGSTVRDQAMIMETLVKLGKRNEAYQMLSQIAKRLGDNNYWMSTQTTAYCLIGIAEYTKGFPATASLKANVKIDNQTVKLNETGYFAQVIIANADRGNQLTVTNNSGAPLYARVIRTGIPLEGGELAESKNMSLKTTYYDREGRELDISSIAQGTDFSAVVTVHNPGTRGELKEIALTQIFPSGWEILNTRMTDGAVQDKDKATYKDIRDDRVLTYFDLKVGERKQFTVKLNAAYRGQYYLPTVQAEAMYDNSIYAAQAGKWVSVVE